MTSQLPTIETLQTVAKLSGKAYLLENCTFEVVWYDGELQPLWDICNPSYVGYRTVSLRCTDLSGEVYDLVFFDHEDDAATFTYVTVQFND